MDFNKMRGHVEVDGIGLGMQLEAFQLATELIVQDNDEPQPIFSADLLSLMISRYGDYILEGVNIQSSLAGSELALDVTGLYNPGTQAIEAGLGLHKDIDLLHDFEMWNISLNEATGAFGLGGESLRYIGLNLEASWNFVPFRAGAFGGQVLAGSIDPNSPILQSHFPEVLDHLHIVPAAPGENQATTLLKGGYVRLYGDVTQGNRKIAKVLTVNGGARSVAGTGRTRLVASTTADGWACSFTPTTGKCSARAATSLSPTNVRHRWRNFQPRPGWRAASAPASRKAGRAGAGAGGTTGGAGRAGAQTELVYNTTEDDFDASWEIDFE
ncbi:hypothetical protein HC891_23980 [Candidatus Gracilibacteria bacterium]|nr:hypothetical protein [Candidatus Gracilibacteria bacterium]